MKGKTLTEEISRGKAHTNICKLIRNILMITDFFLNQKIVNVCGHMVDGGVLKSATKRVAR